MFAPEPCAAPPPDPGRLLLAAQLLSIGEPLSLAAARAGLRPDQLRAFRDDPDSGFAELLDDAEVQAALPQAEQDARLLKLTRLAIERALATGRLGAIPAALRLLGLLPTRATTGPRAAAGAPSPRPPRASTFHPARIEDTYYASKAEIEDTIVQAGEQAVFEANCGEFHEELVKILGRLRFRTSYGQNVLKHTLEVVHLAGIMASEVGASVKVTKRAALLHDIGKAMTHEVEGSHASISAQLARRYGESQHVVHAIEAHHYEVEPQTVEAVLLIAADAISASRPGARGESLEHYIKRLESLEELAAQKPGVDKVYALQAGREIRVIVRPSDVDDDAAVLLSHEIAREIEDQLEYPGQVKVTVIRESRAVDVARNVSNGSAPSGEPLAAPEPQPQVQSDHAA